MLKGSEPGRLAAGAEALGAAGPFGEPARASSSSSPIPKVVRVVAQVFGDKRGGEAVEAGFHRGVGGEEVAGPCGGEGHGKVDPRVLHVTARPLQDGEGSVALVQMADLRGDPQARASTRQPPMPRIISCCRRISLPPPYNSLVMPRSAGLFIRWLASSR